MTRQINKPITVNLVHDPQWDDLRPASFTRGQIRYTVTAAIDRWEEVGRWWEQEEAAVVWRLQLGAAGMCEVARVGDQWRLMVVYD